MNAVAISTDGSKPITALDRLSVNTLHVLLALLYMAPAASCWHVELERG
jgi:hypothetical protein